MGKQIGVFVRSVTIGTVLTKHGRVSVTVKCAVIVHVGELSSSLFYPREYFSVRPSQTASFLLSNRKLCSRPADMHNEKHNPWDIRYTRERWRRCRTFHPLSMLHCNLE